MLDEELHLYGDLYRDLSATDSASWDSTMGGGGRGARSRSLAIPPSNEVLALLNNLTSDSANSVCIVSGRSRTELGEYLKSTPNVGIAAEHGCARVLLPLGMPQLRVVISSVVPACQRSWARAVCTHVHSPSSGPVVLRLPSCIARISGLSGALRGSRLSPAPHQLPSTSSAASGRLLGTVAHSWWCWRWS